MGGDLSMNSLHRGKKLLFNLRRQIFVGKIDQRFLIGQDTAQPICPILIDCTQFAVELA